MEDLSIFKLENGNSVPEHFHVTEVGIITKDFIDCGGTEDGCCMVLLMT